MNMALGLFNGKFGGAIKLEEERGGAEERLRAARSAVGAPERDDLSPAAVESTQG